ncbi:MAG: amidase [Pseudomonadota bacterium]|nr:amidase [Pseudomonadota bacterium]
MDKYPNKLSLSEAASAIAVGSLSSEELVQSCIDRIEERENAVQAWAYFDPELALDQARRRDNAKPDGPLHGVPIGVKDIIDTMDMPTEYNSPIYKNHRPSIDAACVARLRQAGAIIMGKTVTTEFASSYPGPTRNPINTAHTPGGSSQGSAAAVADFMVQGALGTQTGGSVIRPNAYCGTVGYKPPYNTYDKAGVKPLAPIMDTVGLMVRSILDVGILSSALSGLKPAKLITDNAPNLLLHRTGQWDAAEDYIKVLIEDCAKIFSSAGAQVRDHAFVQPYDNLQAAQRVVMAVEACREFKEEWMNHQDLLSKPFQDLMLRGFETTPEERGEAEGLLKYGRGNLSEIFTEGEILLTPGAPGEAPKGIGSTGDSIFNRAWTFLGVACLYLPVTNGPNGLPIGIQLIDPHNNEARLLSAGVWCAKKLGLDAII